MSETETQATSETELLLGRMSWKQATIGAVAVSVATGIGVLVLFAVAQLRYESGVNLNAYFIWTGLQMLFAAALYLFCVKGLDRIDQAILWSYRIRGVQFSADRRLPKFIRQRNKVRLSGFHELFSTMVVIYFVMHDAQQEYDDYTTTTGQAVVLFAWGFCVAFFISLWIKRGFGKKYKWYYGADDDE